MREDGGQHEFLKILEVDLPVTIGVHTFDHGRDLADGCLLLAESSHGLLQIGRRYKAILIGVGCVEGESKLYETA